MLIPGRDLRNSYACECAAGYRYGNIAINQVPGSKLTAIVQTPTGNSAIRNQRTSVVSTGRYLGDSFSGECATGYRYGNIDTTEVAGAKPPGIVKAPTGDCAIGEQCTRMAGPGRDLGNSFSGECAAGYRYGNIAINQVPGTESPHTVVAPAGNSAI
jgi:hypothetical protein